MLQGRIVHDHVRSSWQGDGRLHGSAVAVEDDGSAMADTTRKVSRSITEAVRFSPGGSPRLKENSSLLAGSQARPFGRAPTATSASSSSSEHRYTLTRAASRSEVNSSSCPASIRMPATPG